MTRTCNYLYPGTGFCEGEAKGHCDSCNATFCSDHGSVGGDRETEGGLVAVPSQCWVCGGFNADA